MSAFEEEITKLKSAIDALLEAQHDKKNLVAFSEVLAEAAKRAESKWSTSEIQVAHHRKVKTMKEKLDFKKQILYLHENAKCVNKSPDLYGNDVTWEIKLPPQSTQETYIITEEETEEQVKKRKSRNHRVPRRLLFLQTRPMLRLVLYGCFWNFS